MSEEQLKAFWEAIEADAGLQQKLQEAIQVIKKLTGYDYGSDAESSAIAVIAKEAGFSISAEEIKKARERQNIYLYFNVNARRAAELEEEFKRRDPKYSKL